MEQALTARQFYGVLKEGFEQYISGNLPRQHSPEKAQDFADIVKTVANADDQSSQMLVAYRHTGSDGDEEVFAVSRGESRDLIANVTSNETTSPNTLRLEEESSPRRAIMRLYQHNQDPLAGEKKRTQHKAIVSQYGEAPRALLYENQEIADELNQILASESYAKILFDVTLIVLKIGVRIKSYRLMEIHQYFEDDDAEQFELGQ